MRINEILPYQQLHEGIIDNLKRYFSQQKEAKRQEYVGAINGLIAIIRKDTEASHLLQSDYKLIKLLKRMGVQV